MPAKKKATKEVEIKFGKESIPDQVNKELPVATSVMKLMAKGRALAGDEVEESQALGSLAQANEQWGKLGAVVPPYDPESLLNYIELTPHLQPCIESMSQNIDGYGYQPVLVEPWMDNIETTDAEKAIAEALFIEDWVSSEEEALTAETEVEELKSEIAQLKKAKKPRKLSQAVARLKELEDQLAEPKPEPPSPVSPEDLEEDMDDEEENEIDAEYRQRVAEEQEKLTTQIKRERFMFDAWFKNCCSESSFTKLRKNMREDYEAHGWGCIEFRRDGYGRLKRLSYVPAYTVRPMQSEGEVVEVAEDDAITPLSENREVIVKRRFRIFVQIVGSKKVYYKSPGDPRVISRTTGKSYDSVQSLTRSKESNKNPGEGKKAVPANELLWIAQHDPKTPCPPPRWIGNLLAVLGVREADETNYFYLADNAIPSGILFVHGGTVPKATKERLEKRIKHEIGGAENSGKILIVEAKPGGTSNPNEKTMQPSLTFQSLRDTGNSDALFTEYDKRSADRIGASFRLPPMLRGYTPSSMNRATALASLGFAEQQVFEPERQDFDWLMNKYVLPEINIKLWKFQSNSPPTRSAEDIGKLVQATAPQGGLIPAEIRELLADVLNRPLKTINEPWTQQPMPLTLSGGGGAVPGAGGDADINERLLAIENTIAQVVTEELRQAGLDLEVTTGFVDSGDADFGSDGDDNEEKS
jgi:PBSX family phage portal protein